MNDKVKKYYDNDLTRFLVRVWSNEEQKYLDDEDICYDTQGHYNNALELLNSEFFNRPDEAAVYQNDEISSNNVYEQCSGYTDANDNLIFEGDIIQGKLTKNYLSVSFSKGAFIVNNYSNSLLADLHNQFIVVGNIHENKDLIK